MITEINNPKEPRHYLAHNGEDVFHYGILEPGQCLITGQPFLEDYATPEEWMTKAEEVGLVTTKAEYVDQVTAKEKTEMNYQQIAVKAKEIEIVAVAKIETDKIAAEQAVLPGDLKDSCNAKVIGDLKEP